MLTDLRLPGISGLELIREIREREMPVTVIAMTGYATVEAAVEAMKLGAYDLILKPIDTIRLEVVVNQALEDRQLIDEVADLRSRLRKKYAYHNLLGPKPTDGGRLRSGGAGGVVAVQRAGDGRDGDRQGTGGRGDPFQRRDP